MISEVAYGLLAAAGWGSGDFLGKLSSDRIGYLRTALYMQLISGVFLIVFALPDLSRIILAPLATFESAGLGLVSLVGILVFYKGFQVGKVSVVSPIASGYPALTSMLAVLLLGEVISSIRVVGIILTLAGIVLVSIQSHRGSVSVEASVSSGVIYAFAAFVSFGILYFLMKLVVVQLGIWVPILLLRGVSAIVLLFFMVVFRRGYSPPKGPSLGIVAFVGVFDTVGNIAFNLGVISGSVAIVSTLSGLFSVVTIGLVSITIRERVTWYQVAGILLILFGVGFIGLFA